jgi:two-component system sensor histidine kinase PilS (NtrC family)
MGTSRLKSALDSMKRGLPLESMQPGSELIAAPESLLRSRLQWLMLFRVLFTTMLLGATVLLHWQRHSLVLLDPPMLIIYGIIGATYLLTVIYARLFPRLSLSSHVQMQLSLDAMLVTAVVYVTGGYGSVFSFLYLVVIIYSSIFMGRRGILAVAAFCSALYAALLTLEFYQILLPFDVEQSLPAVHVGWANIVFKTSITALACFLVGMLSAVLSEQERRTQRELKAVREHMRRVEKMAAIGEMASRLAHEIKNPLAALVGSAHLLDDELQLDDSHQKLMGIICREADRLNNLVSEFLTFARPVSGAPQPIRLVPAISETLELFLQDKAVSSRIRVITKYNPDIVINMDPHHFRQVLWNLLLNSAEAIKGEGQIRIETQTGHDGAAVILVKDSGIGMDRDTQQCMFEPFFTTRPGGSGLGLSIVHRIIEAYGFRLDVESAPGKGSTFSIVAPKSGLSSPDIRRKQ